MSDSINKGVSHPRTMSFTEELPNHHLGLETQKDHDIASKLEVCFLNEDEGDHPNKCKSLEDFLLSDFNVSLSDKRMSFMDALAAPFLTFKLCLHCTTMATKKEVKLTVSKAFLNCTVNKLKLVIEHQQDIPASCQTLTFGGSILEDQHLMSHHYLRNGDSLEVSFEGTGDVKEVLAGVDHLREIYHWLRASEKDLREGNLPDEALEELRSRKDQSHMNDVYSRFLSSTNKKRSQINRRFFVECGGLIITRILHEELLKYPATYLPYTLLGMEKFVLSLYWDFSVCSAIFPCMWKSKVLFNISRSFLRVKFDSTVGVQAQNLLYTTGNSHVYETKFQLLLKGVIMSAMGALCNFAEKPGYELKIASTEAILEQLRSIMSWEVENLSNKLVCMGGFVCLSFQQGTHQHLGASSMSVILKGYQKSLATISKASKQSQLRKNFSMFQYLVVIFFAQILTESPQLVDSSQKELLLDIYWTFFEQNTFSDMHQLEIEQGYTWVSVIPYMKLAFHPYFNPQDSMVHGEQRTSESRQLDRYCIQLGLFSLSNILQSQHTRDTLVREGLLDYLVCIPWLYPTNWTKEKKQAKDLLNYVGNHLQLQPPSLITISKARLAGYLGLEKVLSADIHQMLAVAI